MTKNPVEIGNVYGRLTVVDQAGRNKHGQALWLCECYCGSSHIVRGYSLQSGGTKSCGCLKKELTRERQLLPEGQATFNQLYGNYKRDAELRRDLEFTLTKEDFSFLTRMNCFYCGLVPNQVIRCKGYNGNYIYNGIDRIDSDKGYSIDNVIPCCKQCNFAKRQLAKDEFLEWVERIYEYQHRNQV